MKKFLALVLVLALALSLAACGSTPSSSSSSQADPGSSSTPEGSDVTIKVAALVSGYENTYPGMWKEVCDAFEAETGIKVELTLEQNLEDVLNASMQGGDYPDVIHLATGRPAGLTEQFVNGKMIADITDVLSMNVPGEDVKVGDKIIEGFTETSATNPYGDGKTYMAPMFYSPCGLFYNAGLFEEKGWIVPTTWDEMWELGEKAKAEGIYLFTYPTAGYFDAFLYALMNVVGGSEFFNAATSYEEGVWDTPEADKLFEILDKLADYTHPSTPAQANNQDFTRNQLMVMTGDALFMPNGTWIIGEMAEAEIAKDVAEGFNWGMTALPAVDENGIGYSYTFLEQAWIPAEAEHLDEAKTFLAFLYSDKAAGIFAKGGAVQPIRGMTDSLEGDNKLFYSIYDNGAGAAMGGFAAYSPIPGIDNTSVFFEPINSLVEGSLTIEDWKANIISATDQMRANLVG